MAILPPPYSARKDTTPILAPLQPPKTRSTMPTSTARSRSVSTSVQHTRTLSEPVSAPRLKHRFTFSNLRSSGQPPLSRGMYKLIKSENTAITSYSTAGDSRVDIASQLSSWGEGTADPAVSSLSDKLGILLTALGQEEKHYAAGLEEYRCVLKQIRNTESGVQPTRERIRKINEDIRRLQYKEPTSGKIVQLEQELVRAEAENLVAEAQLTNVTRAKLKEAYAVKFAAVVERAERQIMLAKYGRMLLELLDDTPIVPGDTPPAFISEPAARAIIHECEDELRNYTLDVDRAMPVTSHAHVVAGGVLDGKSAATLAAPSTPQIASIMPSPQPRYISPLPVRSAPPVPEIPAAFREKARQQLEARQQRISSSTDETEDNSDDDLYVPGGFMQPGIKHPVRPQEKGYLSTVGTRNTHPALREDRERDSGDEDDDDRSIYSCTTSGRGRTMLLEKEPPMPGGMVMI